MRYYYDNCSGGGRSAKSKQLLGYLRVCGIQIYICTNMLNISVECRMDVICRQVGGRWMETWNESLCPKTSESRAAMRKKICSLSKKTRHKLAFRIVKRVFHKNTLDLICFFTDNSLYLPNN